MSQENVDLVHRAIEAFNRQDIEALDAMSCEDFEFVSVLTAVDAEGATYRGPTAWTDYFAVMHDTWSDWRVEDLRVFDGGDTFLAGLFRIVGTGKSSGAPVAREVGITYQVRDGKFWRMRSHMQPSDALAAIGLEP